MSAFIFRIACPRCETAIDIYLGKQEFECTCCTFQVVIEDGDGLLNSFKSGEVEDLDFVEVPLRNGGMMDSGLKLVFTKQNSSSTISASDKVQSSTEIDEDEFGNKTANTQVIQLTFDPAKYLEEMKATSAKNQKRKISLKNVIKHGELAKPPKNSSREKTIKVMTIVATCLLLIVILVFVARSA
jgi:hypothetical protein